MRGAIARGGKDCGGDEREMREGLRARVDKGCGCGCGSRLIRRDFSERLKKLREV